MSDRSKPHNGRDLDGQFKVRRADVDDVQLDPQGEEIIREDVRLGGAIEDTGPQAGQHGGHVKELIDENRENVQRTVHPDHPGSSRA